MSPRFEDIGQLQPAPRAGDEAEAEPTSGGPTTVSSPRPGAGAQRRLLGGHPALKFVVKRVVAGVLTLLVASILIFVATNILPGNIAEVVLGHNATPSTVHALEAQIGLDHSLVHRYLAWLGGAVHGQLGQSASAVAHGRPDASIASTLKQPLIDSLVLGGITALLLLPLTLLLGTLAGMRAGRLTDHLISVPSLVLGGLPEFVTGTLLIFVFFSKLGWLPPVTLLEGSESPLSAGTALILPVVTLLVVALAGGVRQVRSGVAESLKQDYVHVARINGIPERRVLLCYALRNSLAPSVQITAQSLQYLVGGIIVVESVFTYPGVGTFLVNAVSDRDVTSVQAAALILAAIYIAINILADLIVVFLVPKLRTGLR